MGTKQLLFNDAARGALLAGVDAVADAVEVTLGPRGRNVLYIRPEDKPTLDEGGLTITNDGVSVASQLEFADRAKNLGATLVREAAANTNHNAGDGTTTAILLARAMLRAGLHRIAAGAEPVPLRRGIEWAVERAVEHLREQAIEVDGREQLERVATISGGDPEVAKMVADAFDRLGPDAVVTVEPGQTTEIEYEITSGTKWNRGYISPYFITNEQRGEAVLDEPYILLVDRKLESAHELLHVFELVKETGKPLFIVARRVDGEALAMLLVNKFQGVLQSAAAMPPDYALRRRRMMDDIAVMTGGKVVSEESGLELDTLTLDDLGRANRVISDRHTTTIIEGWGDPEEIAARRKAMREEAHDTAYSFYRRKFTERQTRLASQIALFRVGAHTDAEITERRMRLDDAVQATRAALEEGIVPGGGTAFLRAQEALAGFEGSEDEAIGVGIVRDALADPVARIASNSGFDGQAVLARVREMGPREGFDAFAGVYGDLVERGVIDPVKVVRTALENAASVAKTLLLAEALVLDLSAPPRRSRASRRCYGASVSSV